MESKSEFRARVQQITGLRYRAIPLESTKAFRQEHGYACLPGMICARRAQIYVCCVGSPEEGRFVRVHLDE